MGPRTKREAKHDDDDGHDDGKMGTLAGGKPVIERRNPSHIKNKMKRQLVMQKYRKEKKEAKKATQLKRRREAEEMGEDAAPKMEPRTIDNTREKEVTMVSPDGDEEVDADERDDEFASIFANEEAPKLMITTRPFPSGDLYHFIHDLLDLLPNSFYYKRGTFDIKEIVQFACNKKFTHLVVLSEKSKICNGYVANDCKIEGCDARDGSDNNHVVDVVIVVFDL